MLQRYAKEYGDGRGAHLLHIWGEKFMANEPLSEEELDKQAYADAERQFELVQKVLPRHAVEALAQEVVRRLSFRLPRNVTLDGMPDAARCVG